MMAHTLAGMRSLCLLIGLAASAAAQSAQAPLWTLSARPTVEIGDDADPPKQFNRIGSVVRLGDGSIVVANGGSGEIRVFGPRGDYLRTLSRKGQGPGEVNALRKLIVAGDTIIAPDAQPGTSVFHFFSPSGFLSRIQLRQPGRGGVAPIDRFADGRFAVTPGFHALPDQPVGTMYTDTLRLGVLTLSETATPEWIGEFPSIQIWLVDSPFMPGRPFPVTFTFGLQRAQAVSGDRLWVGDSRTGVVTQFNSAGKRVGSFTVPIEPRGFRDDVIERVKAARIAAAESKVQKVMAEGLYAAPRPGQAPLFTEFLPGTGGEMWVRLFDEDPATPSTFVVLNQSGKAIGRIVLPMGFTPQDVGADYLLGVHRDDDGVEHVVEYALRRR
jgi:hypothetical protein